MPARTSWARPGLHRRRRARALEHHVDRAVDHQAGLGDGGDDELVGVADHGGADGAGQRLAARVGLDARDVVDAHRAHRGDGEGADRAGAEHQDPVAGDDAALVDGVQGDGQRLGQGGGPEVEALGYGQQLGRPLRRVGGEGAALLGLVAARRVVTARRTATGGRRRNGARRRSGGRAATTTSPTASGRRAPPTAATWPTHSWPPQVPAPSPRAPCAGRCRRCRTGRPRPARRRADRRAPGPSSTDSRPGPWSTAAASVRGPRSPPDRT